MAIRQQAAKIKQLIEDLNLTSKLEYDMQPLRVEELSPVELVRQVVCDFWIAALMKGSLLIFSQTRKVNYTICGG